ncbi:TPA: hypothetical protein JS209_000983 [Escherichia coli]|nr:hypothetical protein [Escherichia coli]
MTNFEHNHKSKVNPHFIIEHTLGGLFAILVPAAAVMLVYMVIDLIIKAFNNGICMYAVCY